MATSSGVYQDKCKWLKVNYEIIFWRENTVQQRQSTAFFYKNNANCTRSAFEPQDVPDIMPEQT